VIDDAFSKIGVSHSYIDTGQHYDSSLSNDIQNDLGIKSPIINLKVGSHTHAVQTARIMERLEVELSRLSPKTLLVYGDTNSTIAATLVAVKMGIKVAHIEAGLRSFNRSMPEEINRIATDHLADILFCPTNTAMDNLSREGLSEKSLNVGDVMCDLLIRDSAKFIKIEPSHHGLAKDFLIATIHRAENTDSAGRLKALIESFSSVQKQIVLFARLSEFNLKFSDNVIVRGPVTHSALLSWAVTSAGIITDSGGLQKEAFILKVPCTTIRNETEWIETLENGWNVLVPDLSQLKFLLNVDRNRPQSNPFGDGKAAERIVTHLIG
jgi:UDP-N-acetylglucosamine 2-epimerase (non-hydrolysing)